MYISFVVPVFNEEGNVSKLHEEILKVAKAFKKEFEIIFIDDGSTDKTAEILKTITPLKIITLRRNSGQTAALDAGFKASRGKYVVSLDGDLQNDPASIPAMISKLEAEKLDVVCGWRQKRQDSFGKKFISYGAKLLRERLIRDRVHDAGCTLRVYKKECFEGMTLRGEMHRFIPALLVWRGFKIGEMPVKHRPRLSGVSKYNLTRTIKGLMDMLTLWFFHKFAARPLHMLGALGILSFGVGFLIAVWMLIEKFIFLSGIGGRMWPLVAVFMMLFGVQIFVSGLIMDLIIRAYNPKFYEIKGTTDNN
ncbi:MAG: glycosyltransferase family 2 protein [Candidatus Pacebacteria bacterium]|nr:glycosyltransferase family 2 protein [Candidatus Paceibacterota bacterium]